MGNATYAEVLGKRYADDKTCCWGLMARGTNRPSKNAVTLETLTVEDAFKTVGLEAYATSMGLVDRAELDEIAADMQKDADAMAAELEALMGMELDPETGECAGERLLRQGGYGYNDFGGEPY